MLAFWALWSERSTEQLADFQKLQTEMNHDDRIVFLGACLDGDADAVLKAVEARGYQWTQTCLNSEELSKSTMTFDVSTLPAIYLLDTDGHVVARDLEGDRLRVAVQRALQKN